jgi:hypothetical protein
VPAIQLNLARSPWSLPTPHPRKSAFVQTQGYAQQINMFTQQPHLLAPISPERLTYSSAGALRRLGERDLGVRSTGGAVRAVERHVRRFIGWEWSTAARDRDETDSYSSGEVHHARPGRAGEGRTSDRVVSLMTDRRPIPFARRQSRDRPDKDTEWVGS